MRTIAKVQDSKKEISQNLILRNISRILDVRILNIDMENRTVTFVYDSVVALEKAKRELRRIGYPILHCEARSPIT